jgi:hypothetical protein
MYVLGPDGSMMMVTVTDSGMIIVTDAPPPPPTDGPAPDGTMPTDSPAGGDTGCPDTGTPVACTPTSTGGLTLTSNYLPATDGIGMGGYAFAYSDSAVGGTSTACISPTQFCAVGTVDVDNYPATPDHYGAGIGFNLNQAQATSCTGTPIMPYTISSSAVGVAYTLSNLPAGGARLIIGDAVTSDAGVTTGTDYCVLLTSASGTVPWAKFNTECWSNAGTFLTGPPANPIHLNIGLPSGATPSSFDFCVNALSFATTITMPDSGPVTACGGTACCVPSSGPSASGSGEFTCYTFKQGTVGNKTFCGYQGSETGGPGGTGACQAGELNYNDTVPNVGTASNYFAAFPSSNPAWGAGAYCGMCVNVPYAGTTKMATIVDECATCGDSAEHIDLSAALARDLGIGVGSTTGDVSGVTWQAVECPVTGNIVAVQNSTGQFYFQNVRFPVKSVSGASQSNGFWSPIGSGSVTLTDMLGHTVSAVVPPGGGSLGVQFTAGCP